MAETKAAYTHVGPGLPPLYGARAKALILGSFPSPKSREQGFFYGHPQNRFWPLMASLTGEPVDPCRDEFSAFIFKIQANMNKAHRDRIAFMRI